MRFADIRTEWRVEQIERDLQRKVESNEVSTLRSDVDSLERANRALSSCIDGLRATCETLLQRSEEIEWKNRNEVSE
jgi:predicted RNase H-like nuclease (RuvC/YqgF family)